VVGGTHVRSALPFEFFARTFLPVVTGMGPVVKANMGRPGFYPQGRRQCSIEVTPVPHLDSISLMERGAERA